MGYVRWLNEIGSGDQGWAGDKATGLGELMRAGVRVPRGFCVGASAYRDTFTANHLDEKIVAHLTEIEVGDPAQLEQAAQEIREWIEELPLAESLEQEIQGALDALDASTTAVRSSRVSEDVPNPTASGLQQASLAVPSGKVLEFLRRCWATPWSSRAIYFQNRKKISPALVSMAVIVQTMVNADAAGVMFTASPMGKNPNEIHIDAIWGLGEAVVAARWRPDHFVVEKATGVLREKNIASKTVMNVAAAEGGVQTIGVPAEKQESACLSETQVLALAQVAKRVEAHFKELQDIEWCVQGDQILILQTRPMIKK